jgi:hypothetical protein
MNAVSALLAAALLFIVLPATGAHITDRLVAELYDAPDAAATPERLLETGTPLEVLEQEERFIRVRLSDGSTGWVERRYVTDEKPSRVRLLELQAETGALKHRLAEAERALAAARARLGQHSPSAGPSPRRDPGGTSEQAPRSAGAPAPGLWHYLAFGAALVIGFGAGVAAYDHRVRRRFGGFRI